MTAATFLQVSNANGGGGATQNGVYAYGMCKWDNTHAIFGWTQNGTHHENCLRAVTVDGSGVATVGTTFVVRNESTTPATTDIIARAPQLVKVGSQLVMLNAEGIWTLSFNGTTFAVVAGPQAFPAAFDPAPGGSTDASHGRRIIEWGTTTLLAISAYQDNSTTPKAGVAAFASWTGSTWTWGPAHVNSGNIYHGGVELLAAERLYSASSKTAVGFVKPTASIATTAPFVLFKGDYPTAPTVTTTSISSALRYGYSENDLVRTDNDNLLHVGTGTDWVPGSSSWKWRTNVVSSSGSTIVEGSGTDRVAADNYGEGWGVTAGVAADTDAPWIHVQKVPIGSTTVDSRIWHSTNNYIIPSTDGGFSGYYKTPQSVLLPTAYITGYLTLTNHQLRLACIPTGSPPSPDPDPTPDPGPDTTVLEPFCEDFEGNTAGAAVTTSNTGFSHTGTGGVLFSTNSFRGTLSATGDGTDYLEVYDSLRTSGTFNSDVVVEGKLKIASTGSSQSSIILMQTALVDGGDLTDGCLNCGPQLMLYTDGSLGGTNNMKLLWSGGSVSPFISPANSDVFTLAYDTWYHVLMTWDDTTAKFDLVVKTGNDASTVYSKLNQQGSTGAKYFNSEFFFAWNGSTTYWDEIGVNCTVFTPPVPEPIIRNLVINPSAEQAFNRAWTASNGTIDTDVVWGV